ncbi:hypothetical protein NEA10_07505 [Phormidium yuhuli AB48]|uniref:Uncharacterized protein n=1 Tax=Phormidium yuhuli AB48 TaxID=2940671 RepID=A0ABY5ATL1_9CYAN|nr:hypothetical protein [Phormidium yuhuli]USR92554.1 hypothetical protein NEA10_07505 [Phormidium yuhuli AB48]
MSNAHPSTSPAEVSTPAQRDSPGRGRKPILEVLEIASLAASGVGIGMALVTQQLFHAVVPITVSMSFGVVNRQRFHRRMQQQYQEAVTQLYETLQVLPEPVELDPVLQRVLHLEQHQQRMSNQLEHVNRELRNQNNVPQINALQQQMTSLQEDLQQMQAYVQEQRQREQQLMGQIQQLQGWYENLSSPQQATEYKRAEHAIALLHRELAVIKGRLAPLENQDIQQVQANIRQLQAYLQELTNGVTPLRRRQRDMVRRLFPRMIHLINDLRQPDSYSLTTPARSTKDSGQVAKAIAQRPAPPTPNHTLRKGPLTPKPEPPPRPTWQTQAEILRQRAHQRQQQQHQGDSQLPW